MNLANMSFDHGMLHLANWLGNVIMPTLAAAFIIIAILQFSKGQEFARSTCTVHWRAYWSPG